MAKFTDYELSVMREAISNYTSNSGGLTKANAQVRILRKVETEMRYRKLIKPIGAKYGTKP